jgi:hypothetical protein
MTLRTLADVRKLIEHVPEDRRQVDKRQRVTKGLDEAASCGQPPGRNARATCVKLPAIRDVTKLIDIQMVERMIDA